MTTLLMLFVIFSCKSKRDSTKVLSTDDIIGTWRNVSMKITFPEPDSTFIVPEGAWAQILQINPIETTYNPDGEYTSNYYNTSDSLLFTSAGTWKISQDSLYLTEGGVTTGYHVSIDGSRARFLGMLDWDQDGKADDLYDGVQEKGQQ